METPGAADAPKTVKQRQSLLHFAANPTQQQKGSALVIAVCQTNVAVGQHDPQAGEQEKECLKPTPEGVLLHHPWEMPLVPTNF